MADEHEQIFISYKREDRERAKNLRRLLWNKSWSVFLDDGLPPGKPWQTELKRKLENVICVVALWSSGSSGSNVQFDEANIALSRGALALAKVDDVELPLGLQTVQCIDLTDWKGEETHGGISRRPCTVVVPGEGIHRKVVAMSA